MARILLFLSPHFPNHVSSFLTANGYTVLEAKSVAEAEDLAIGRTIDAVILAAGPPYAGFGEPRLKRMEVELSIHAISQEVYSELSLIIPTSNIPVQ